MKTRPSFKVSRMAVQVVRYPLTRVENEGAEFSLRVERMRLSKDKRSITYNDFLTLEGFTEEAFEYRLGNRLRAGMGS